MCWWCQAVPSPIGLIQFLCCFFPWWGGWRPNVPLWHRCWQPFDSWPFGLLWLHWLLKAQYSHCKSWPESYEIQPCYDWASENCLKYHSFPTGRRNYWINVFSWTLSETQKETQGYVNIKLFFNHIIWGNCTSSWKCWRPALIEKDPQFPTSNKELGGEGDQAQINTLSVGDGERANRKTRSQQCPSSTSL